MKSSVDIIKGCLWLLIKTQSIALFQETTLQTHLEVTKILQIFLKSFVNCEWWYSYKHFVTFYTVTIYSNFCSFCHQSSTLKLPLIWETIKTNILISYNMFYFRKNNHKNHIKFCDKPQDNLGKNVSKFMLRV